MVKVDYISTKDINRVAKLHSNKKYINWNLKIVEDEYRFYPPITIDASNDLDDFLFEQDEVDDEVFDLPEASMSKLPMFGELWDIGAKFIADSKDNIVSSIEDSITSKKMKNVSKFNNRKACIEKYQKNKKQDDDIKLDDYRAYKVHSDRIAKIEKYEQEEKIEKQNDSIFIDKINEGLDLLNKLDEVEVLA